MSSESAPAAPPPTPAQSTPPASSPPVEKVSADTLNDELPEVNDNAIRSAEADGATPSPAADLGKDSIGRAFDAEKFRPEKDSVGRWKNLRGGRKPLGAKTATNAPATPGGSVVPQSFPNSAADKAKAAAAETAAKTAAPAAPAGPDVHELTAEAYLRAGYATADTLVGGGAECQPDDAEEHAGLKSATAAWLRTRKGEELSPGYAFALAVGSFILKRLRRPRVAAALVKYFPGLADFLGVEKPKPAAAPDPAVAASEKKPAAAVAAPAPDPFGGLAPQ